VFNHVLIQLMNEALNSYLWCVFIFCRWPTWFLNLANR